MSVIESCTALRSLLMTNERVNIMAYMGGENKIPEMKMIPTAQKPSLPSHILGVPVLATINRMKRSFWVGNRLVEREVDSALEYAFTDARLQAFCDH